MNTLSERDIDLLKKLSEVDEMFKAKLIESTDMATRFHSAIAAAQWIILYPLVISTNAAELKAVLEKAFPAHE